MIDSLFRKTAAEEGWSQGAQIALLLRFLNHHCYRDAFARFLDAERSARPQSRPHNDDGNSSFLSNVAAILQHPGLLLDAEFRCFCLNSRGLLTPAQTAGRWLRWRSA